MNDDQADVPGVCKETTADRIARKHERQLARRRVRTCEEIGREIDAEDERHICNKIEEVGRHRYAIDALLDELKRVGK